MTDVLAVGAAHPTAPSFRIRVLLPSGELARYGVSVRPLSLLEHAGSIHTLGRVAHARAVLDARRSVRSELHRSDATVSLITRQADLLPLLELERFAVHGRRMVYDVDDAIWVTGPLAGGHPLAFMKGSKRKARWLAARADHVMAGNEFLAEWLSPHAKVVSVIPSLIDVDSAPQRAVIPRPEVVIGWIGSPTTAPYLARLKHPLERAAAATGIPITLLVVGGHAPAVSGIEHIYETPWSPANEAAALTELDIGVMPLPDNDWTRGKCAYKAIQYMASGVPVLADDVGVTRGVIGDAGWVLDDEGAWVEALVELIRSVSLRQRLGTAGRARARTEFSVRAWAPRIAQVLTGP